MSSSERPREGVKRQRASKSTYSSDEGEADYESQPRRQQLWKQEARKKTRLPLILPTGETIIPEVEEKSVKKKEESEDEEEPSAVPEVSKKQAKRMEEAKKEFENKEKAMEAKKQQKELSAAGMSKKHKQAEEVKKTLSKLRTTQQKVTEIVSTSEAVISSPEVNLYRLEVLFVLASEKSASHAPIVSLISLGSIMRNLIPGYKIHTDIDSSAQRLSYAVEKLHGYESFLLSFYERLVAILQAKAKEAPHVVAPIVCELLFASPSFNFSDQLLDLCIQFACLTPDLPSLDSDDQPLRDIASRCSQCLLSLVSQDSTLDFGVRVARVVGKVAKNSSKKIAAKKQVWITGSLLSVLSMVDFTDKEASVRREATMRGISENEKISKDVLKDLQASSIYGDIGKFKKNQSEILKELFVMFLRILRTPHLFPEDALSGSLEGLGRLSHLVNVELAVEISAELKRLVTENFSKLTPLDSLQAITGAVRLVKTVGAAMSLDVSWVLNYFCQVVDASLPFLVSNPVAAPSVLELPFRKLITPDLKNTTQDPLVSLADVHPDDRSDFLFKIKETVQLILSCSPICGAGVGTSVSSHGLLQLVGSLLHLNCHLADPICRNTILQLVTRLLEKFPTLLSAFDSEGTVLYGVGEEKSFFWTSELIKTGAASPSVKSYLKATLMS